MKKLKIQFIVFKLELNIRQKVLNIKNSFSLIILSKIKSIILY